MRFGHRFESRYFQAPSSSLLTDLIFYLAGEGNANDSTTNAKDFTNNGGVTFVSGKVSNCFDFELDSTQSLTRTSDADLQVGLGGFTAACWVNLESKPATSMSMMSKWGAAASNSEYQIRWTQSSDRFAFLMRTASATRTLTDTILGAPSLATWYFIVAWYDPSDGKMYLSINDGTANSVSLGADPVSSTADAAIGRLMGGTPQYFDGQIDEAGFWKRVLTPTERTALYNSGNGTTYPFA